MRRDLVITSIIALGIFGVASFAQAATLYLSPAFDAVPTASQFTIDVKIDTEGEAINATEAQIEFDSSLVEFVSADLAGSTFTLWLDEPTLSGTNVIELTGGTPKGVAGGSLHIARLTFRARGTGTATFTFTNAAIAASDGQGTNILSGAAGSNIAIGTGASVPPTPTPTVIEGGVVASPTPTPEVPVVVDRPAVAANTLPQQPVVRVPLYPDPSSWYGRMGEVVVLWDVPADVTRVATLIDQNPNTEPPGAESQLTTGKRFKSLEEGIWYAHVQFRNNIGWGPVTHYRIAIDTTAPLEFEAEIDNASSDNPTPVITFSAGDSLSGVNRVLVIVDDLTPIVASGSPFIMPAQNPGNHVAIIRVIDNAGNSREDDIAYEIIPLPTPTLDFVTQTVIGGEAAFASGRTLPTSFVDVLVVDEDDFVVFRGETQSDENGNWHLSFGEVFGRGTYFVTASVRDSRGAISFPTDVVEFHVRSAPIVSIGPIDLGWFEIIIIVVSLILAAMGVTAWSIAQRRSRRGAYNTIAIRDMDKMNALIAKNMAAAHELVNEEPRGLRKKTRTEFDMYMEKAKKASEDMKRYVTDTVRKTGE